MHKVGILTAAAAAAATALILTAPLTAAAAPATNPARVFAVCKNPTVEALFGADVYSGPDSTLGVGTVRPGTDHAYNCVHHGVDLGRRYSACGETNGNGWIEVTADNGSDGWSPQACFKDVIIIIGVGRSDAAARTR